MENEISKLNSGKLLEIDKLLPLMIKENNLAQNAA